MKIKLYNRDGANLYLVDTGLIEPYIYKCSLRVDSEHHYVLEYCRYILGNDNVVEAIDPSGGPFIALGDEFENKYKIVKINSTNNIWVSERNYDGEEYSYRK
jgi:hypothetical protein